MYTVKEVADLLEVSQVTIYNHLKKNDKELRGNVTKRKGVTYIKDEGLKVLKVSLGIIQVPTIEKKEMTTYDLIDEISLNISNNVKKDYEGLQEDIKNNNDKLEKELQEIKEQNRLLIDMIQEKENRSLLDKIKGLFKE